MTCMYAKQTFYFYYFYFSAILCFLRYFFLYFSVSMNKLTILFQLLSVGLGFVSSLFFFQQISNNVSLLIFCSQECFLVTWYFVTVKYRQTIARSQLALLSPTSPPISTIKDHRWTWLFDLKKFIFIFPPNISDKKALDDCWGCLSCCLYMLIYNWNACECTGILFNFKIIITERLFPWFTLAHWWCLMIYSNLLFFSLITPGSYCLWYARKCFTIKAILKVSPLIAINWTKLKKVSTA